MPPGPRGRSPMQQQLPPASTAHTTQPLLPTRTCDAGSAAAGAALGLLAGGVRGRALLLAPPQRLQLQQVLVRQLLLAGGPQADAAVGGDAAQLQLVAVGALPANLPHRVRVLSAPRVRLVQRLASLCRQRQAECVWWGKGSCCEGKGLAARTRGAVVQGWWAGAALLHSAAPGTPPPAFPMPHRLSAACSRPGRAHPRGRRR